MRETLLSIESETDFEKWTLGEVRTLVENARRLWNRIMLHALLSNASSFFSIPLSAIQYHLHAPFLSSLFIQTQILGLNEHNLR